MTIKESRDDRIMCVILGIVLNGLGGFGFLSIFGLIALSTGIAGFCPSYKVLRKSTCPQ